MDEFMDGLWDALLEPVGEACCELFGKALHHHWPRNCPTCEGVAYPGHDE